MTKQILTTTIQKLVRLLHKPNEADAFVKEHLVIVTPEFDGINVRVTGKNRNDIREYLADLYHDALTQL